jgi:putative ABC transport system permease protein
MLRDIRIATRYLFNEPGFTAGAVLTLALAIGAASAIFSAVSAVLFRPSAIRQPDELVIAWENDSARQLEVVELTYRSVQSWTAHNRSFSEIAAIGSSTWPAVLDRDGEALRVSSAGVSASFFDTLGVVPRLGRGFTPADDEPGALRVVALSHRFWATRFGADPRVIGTTIQLSRPHVVVGVMPEGLDFPRGTDFWTPVVPVIAGSSRDWQPDNLEKVGVLFVVGRLRSGVTRAQAAHELDALARSSSVPRFGSTVVVRSFVDHVFGPVRPALWALLSAVIVLLCIGCANVSGLMLSRVSLRTREQAVRAALGATRGQLGRQWMLEIGMLAVLGGVAGLAVSVWIARGIVPSRRTISPVCPRSRSTSRPRRLRSSWCFWRRCCAAWRPSETRGARIWRRC